MGSPLITLFTSFTFSFKMQSNNSLIIPPGPILHLPPHSAGGPLVMAGTPAGLPAETMSDDLGNALGFVDGLLPFINPAHPGALTNPGTGISPPVEPGANNGGEPPIGGGPVPGVLADGIQPMNWVAPQPGMLQGRYALKLPEWRGDILDSSGDLSAHFEQMKSYHRKNPNATESQMREILLDSLSEPLKVFAKRTQRGPEVPSTDEMLRSLKNLFENMNNKNSGIIDERLGALIQEVNEHPSEFVGRVLEVMQSWYASTPDMTEAPFVERCALTTLTTRSSKTLKDEIRMEMNKWESGHSQRLDPLSSLYSVTEFVLGKYPLQPSSKRSRGGGKKGDPKETKLCRWGKKCFKEGCAHEHPEGHVAPQKKRQRVDTSTKCGFCAKGGHSEEKCWKKKSPPEDRKPWARDDRDDKRGEEKKR
jgi:hypothetical protein